MLLLRGRLREFEALDFIYLFIWMVGLLNLLNLQATNCIKDLTKVSVSFKQKFWNEKIFIESIKWVKNHLWIISLITQSWHFLFQKFSTNCFIDLNFDTLISMLFYLIIWKKRSLFYALIHPRKSAWHN